MKKIELLVPAGSMANLKAAVSSGADSVYLGLERFNARGFANNFNRKNFLEAINICKSNNVKIYLTLNTLIKNNEIEDFFDELNFAYKCGIDAVIIQEISFIEIIKNNFPGLKIHISTQAGVMNSDHANILHHADRINLARELNKENIISIKKNFNKEIEVFVHGALCVSVSGQCLFSSLIGGRSGNRGKCAQPCRKKYNDCYFLSTKELCLIKKIPELIEIGVDSLKIEGRMRTPYYVATVTSIYRKAIDDYYNGKFNITDDVIKKLKTAFDRDFTEGCYSGESLINKKDSSGKSEVLKRFYEVKSNNYVSPRDYVNVKLPKINAKKNQKRLLVRVYNLNDALIADKYADIIYYDLLAKDFNIIKNKIKKPLFGVLPRIVFDSDISSLIKTIKEKKPEGIFTGNLFILKHNLNLPIHLDYNINGFNDFDISFFNDKDNFMIISPELSIDELSKFKNKNFGVLVHGKIRLMTLGHKIPEGTIKDEKGFLFLLKNIFNGTEIFNEKEIGLFNKSKNLLKNGINNFFIDSENSLEEVLSIYHEILNGKTIDVKNLKNNYILGWSVSGVQ